MAYKFQIGAARMSGSLIQEDDVYISSSFGNSGGNAKNLSVQGDATVGADVIMSQGGTVYLAGDGGSAKIVSTGANAVSIFGAKAVFNGSSIEPDTDNGTDLGSSSKEWKDLYLDGVAYIDDLRADTANIDGGNIDGTIIGASSVAAGSFAAVVGTTGTFSGRLVSDDATEATSTTDGSLQTDGGLSVAKSAVIGDDLDLLSNSAIFKVGSDEEFTLTHANADHTLLASSGHRLAFGNAGEYISGDGTDLKIVSSGDVDITGDVDIVGSMSCDTSFTLDAVTINATELGYIDSISAIGTVQASKAVVVDANKDADGFRNMSGSTLFEWGAASLATDMSVGADVILSQNGNLYLAGDGGAAKIVSTGGNAVSIFGAKVVTNGASIEPDTDNGTDLGSSSKEFKDLYLDGVAYIDTLNADALGANLDCANYNMTNVDIDSGAIDNTEIGNTTPSTGKFTTLSGSSTLKVGGTVQLAGVADAAASVAADSFYYLDATDSLMKRESMVDYAASIAGNGIGAASGVLAWAPAELTEAVIATTDYIVFADATDSDNPKKEGVDDLFAIGPALVDEAAVAVSSDYFTFLDGGASGAAKKESIADLVAAMAGAGLNASNGQLSTQAGSVAAIADGGTLAEGYNYLADLSANATVTLPASPSVGDVVHVKAADLNSGANVIISRAGSHTIDDDHTTVRIESNFGAVSLVYVAANKWRLV